MYKKSAVYFVLAMIVYVIMMTYSLPKIQEETNGIQAFDLRPSGYTVLEGQRILDSISDEGRSIYQFIQLPMDFFFPLFFFLFLFNILGAMFEGTRLFELRWFTITVMVFDYLENIGIYVLLNKPSDVVIRITSFMGILKALCTTAAMCAVIIAVVYCIIKAVLGNGRKNSGI